MKVISKDANSAVIEFTKEEIGILMLVGTEFTQGANSPDEQEWETIVPRPRKQVVSLFESLPDLG